MWEPYSREEHINDSKMDKSQMIQWKLCNSMATTMEISSCDVTIFLKRSKHNWHFSRMGICPFSSLLGPLNHAQLLFLDSDDFEWWNPDAVCILELFGSVNTPLVQASLWVVWSFSYLSKCFLVIDTRKL